MVFSLASVLSAIVLASSAPNAKTQQELDSLIRQAKLLATSYGVEVQDLQTGTVIFSQGGDRPLNPASSIKILTSAAALSRLGPNHRFKTALYRSGKDICLKGMGDPSLVNETMWVLVEEARRQGVSLIDGDLLADETYFPRSRENEKAFSGDRDRAFTAPISPLSINYNSVTIHAEPTALGKPPKLFLEPDLPSFWTLQNNAVTATTGERGDLSASVTLQGDRMVIRVGGKVNQKAERVSIYRAVPEPGLYAAQVFAELFRRASGSLKGHVRAATCPVNAKELFQFDSAPLSQVVFGMNKFSNNFIAEMLVAAVGLDTLRDWLKDRGISAPELILENGSGLSRKTRISAKTLVAILRAAVQDLTIGPEFAASLGIAGVDGTMHRRMKTSFAKDRVRAKSGSLSGVVSLTGLGEKADGSKFVFAFLFDGAKEEGYKLQKLEERLLNAILEAKE